MGGELRQLRRQRSLFATIASFLALYEAAERAIRGKRGKPGAAAFRDRVVHHALCAVIAPIFERGFIADSYANRGVFRQTAPNGYQPRDL